MAVSRSLGCRLLLALVDLDVPLAPDLGRGEHAAGTAHVTEGSLTGTVSTTTRDTGDTGDSATCVSKCQPQAQSTYTQRRRCREKCLKMLFEAVAQVAFLQSSLPAPPSQIRVSLTSSPGLSRGLVTGLLAHGVRLALVLGHALVNLLDDVRSDRAGEDGGDGVGSPRGSTIFADDGDGRSRSHCEDETWTCKWEEMLVSVRIGSGSLRCGGRGMLTSVVGRRRNLVMQMEVAIRAAINFTWEFFLAKGFGGRRP